MDPYLLEEVDEASRGASVGLGDVKLWDEVSSAGRACLDREGVSEMGLVWGEPLRECLVEGSNCVADA